MVEDNVREGVFADAKYIVEQRGKLVQVNPLQWALVYEDKFNDVSEVRLLIEGVLDSTGQKLRTLGVRLNLRDTTEAAEIYSLNIALVEDNDVTLPTPKGGGF